MRFVTCTMTFVLASLLAACGGGEATDVATIEGSVTDAVGTQHARLAGQGTVATASRVEAWSVADDGELALLGEASITADGRYAVEVTPGVRRVLMRAVDDAGELVASAILESTGEAGELVPCTPMDTESSVEAEVWLRQIARGTPASDTNPVDLRGRIDADTAAAVHAILETEGDATPALTALADGIRSAQEAEVRAWAELGVAVTQAALFEAEFGASQTLSAALDAGLEPASAYADFREDVSAVARAMGLGPEGEAESEAQASLALRLVVDAQLDGGAVGEAVSLAAARAEARLTAAATEALLRSAGAADHVIDATVDAGVRLQSEVDAATDSDAAAAAFDAFATTVVGDANISGSVLGTWLGAEASAAVDLAAVLDEALDAAVALEADLIARVQADTDAEAAAVAVVEAWGAYRADVYDSVALALLAWPEQVDVAAGLLVAANGSFRAG